MIDENLLELYSALYEGKEFVSVIKCNKKELEGALTCKKIILHSGTETLTKKTLYFKLSRNEMPENDKCKAFSQTIPECLSCLEENFLVPLETLVEECLEPSNGSSNKIPTKVMTPRFTQPPIPIKQPPPPSPKIFPIPPKESNKKPVNKTKDEKHTEPN